jgi:magnesium chelatase accessory protein
MTADLNWSVDGLDWPHRDASRFVSAGGLRWHVQTWQADTDLTPPRPRLLLLHGTGASTHSWRDLAPLLALHFDLIAPDLPGHGFSERLPASRQSLSGMAAALGALLQTLALPPQAVVGHSAGAALMLRMALDGHHSAEALIGLNAALMPFDQGLALLYAPAARLLAAQPLVARLAAWRARDPALVQRLIDATGSRLDTQGHHGYARLMRSPRHVAGVLAMMSDWNLGGLLVDLQLDGHRALPRLKAPLHLLVAERDSTVPPAQAEAVARRLRRPVTPSGGTGATPQGVGTPTTHTHTHTHNHTDAGVQLHRLPGLGHLAHEEAPQAVAQRLLDLLAPDRLRPAPAVPPVTTHRREVETTGN